MAGASRAPAERWGKNTITMVLVLPGRGSGSCCRSSGHRVAELRTQSKRKSAGRKGHIWCVAG